MKYSLKTQHAKLISPFMVVLNLWWCYVVMWFECLRDSHIHISYTLYVSVYKIRG